MSGSYGDFRDSLNRERLSRTHWRDQWLLPDESWTVIDVRRLWWGWWINGAWCPTIKIAMHRLKMLQGGRR